MWCNICGFAVPWVFQIQSIITNLVGPILGVKEIHLSPGFMRFFVETSQFIHLCYIYLFLFYIKQMFLITLFRNVIFYKNFSKEPEFLLNRHLGGSSILCPTHICLRRVCLLTVESLVLRVNKVNCKTNSKMLSFKCHCINPTDCLSLTTQYFCSQGRRRVPPSS